jgi:hypothetical protein
MKRSSTRLLDGEANQFRRHFVQHGRCHLRYCRLHGQPKLGLIGLPMDD